MGCVVDILVDGQMDYDASEVHLQTLPRAGDLVFLSRWYSEEEYRNWEGPGEPPSPSLGIYVVVRVCWDIRLGDSKTATENKRPKVVIAKQNPL